MISKSLRPRAVHARLKIEEGRLLGVRGVPMVCVPRREEEEVGVEGDCMLDVVEKSIEGYEKVFRWVAAGNKTHTQWMKLDPKAYAAHEKLGEERWKEGWNLFDKVPMSGSDSAAPSGSLTSTSCPCCTVAIRKCNS